MSKKTKQKIKRKFNHLIDVVIVALLTLAISYFTNLNKQPHSSSLVNQQLSGSKSAMIEEAILTESRDKQELIVFEQDLKTTTQIEDKFLGWDVFKKSQDMTMLGTAEYTISLEEIKEDDIQVEEETNEVLLKIPHAKLKMVHVDFEKTKFSEIDRGIFGWGSLKLTPEEQNAIEQSMQLTMENKANEEKYLALADQKAIKAVEKLYQPALKQLDLGKLKLIVSFQ